MLVTNRVSGPSHSTDLTAHDLRHKSPRSTSPSPSLEDLYPAWFAWDPAVREVRRRNRAQRTGAVGSGIVALTR